MVDRLFSDARLAALYDAFCPWTERGDFDFYLPYVMAASSVLDVGCGTGQLLRGARDAGHTGRLCGLDPAVGMLAEARKRNDIKWIHGDLASVKFDREFDLVLMTGHAFQVFIDDDELRTALAAIRAALTDDGRFAFETRNPLARAWDRWNREYAQEVVGPDGAIVRMETEVHTVDGGLVCFTHTYTSAAWGHPETSRSTLRFLGAPELEPFLAAAGLAIEQQFGDWDGQPPTDTSPEIITIVTKGS